MSLISENGKTDLKGLYIEWKIQDFFSLSEKASDHYCSPVFNCDDEQWFLSLFPNGDSREDSAGWIGVYLERKACDPPKTVHYMFGIKGSDGYEKTEERERTFSEKDNAWGEMYFCSRSELRNRKSILMPNNELTVTCHLNCNAITTMKDEDKLVESLISMLENGDDSDVVIKVQGKEFPAHKCILRARSPVFKSMFAHDMAEKQSNIVNIEDGDPETFQDFLVHIYSGSCDQISAKNVYSLYAAADKYDFGELKKGCDKFMRRNVTVACFCDVMTVAFKHGDKELVEYATNFFCNNAANIAKTVEWQNFLKENLTLGNELFIKAVSK